jgi:hypothetical protein
MANLPASFSLLLLLAIRGRPRGARSETPPDMQKIIRQLAAEIKVGEHQVKAAVDLLDGGATVPFIARYR